MSADPFVTKRDPFAYRLDPEVYAQGAKLADAFNAGGWYRVEAHGRPPAGQAPAVDAEQVAEAFGFEVVDDLRVTAAGAGNQKSDMCVACRAPVFNDWGGVPVDVPPARCAYDRCQAGGVILAGGEQVIVGDARYHPGCWSAWGHPGACRIR